MPRRRVFGEDCFLRSAAGPAGCAWRSLRLTGRSFRCVSFSGDLRQVIRIFQVIPVIHPVVQAAEFTFSVIQPASAQAASSCHISTPVFSGCSYKKNYIHYSRDMGFCELYAENPDFFLYQFSHRAELLLFS